MAEISRSSAISALLDAATDAARRRHHVIVRAPHVLHVLFTSPGMDRRVRKMGIDADHLRDAAEAVLDGLPAVTGYRDGALPKLCPSVDLAVTRAAPYIAQQGTAELVSAFHDAPELRGAFRPYVLDESIVRHVERDARGSDCADALLLLFGDDLDVAARIAESNLDIEDLTTKSGIRFRDVLANVVDAARREGARAVEARVVIAFLVSEVANSAGYESPVIADAIDSILRGPMPDLDVGDDDDAEIVFVNDPLTTQEAVQHILIADLEMTEAEAYEAMTAIDARDEAVVLVTDGADARELAARARATARSFGHPLRVVVRRRETG